MGRTSLDDMVEKTRIKIEDNYFNWDINDAHKELILENILMRFWFEMEMFFDAQIKDTNEYITTDYDRGFNG